MTKSPVAGRVPCATTLQVFLVHQSLAAWGSTYLAVGVLILVSELGWHFGIETTLPEGQWILYGSPFFPAQVGLALFLGWIIGGTLPHRAMLWVWVLPLVALCLAFVGIQLLPVPSSDSVLLPPINDVSFRSLLQLSIASRLSCFFCRPSAGLEPYIQVIAALPVYSAAAYSLGGLLQIAFFELPYSSRPCEASGSADCCL